MLTTQTNHLATAVISTAGIGGAQRARLLSRGCTPIAHGFVAPPCPIDNPKAWELQMHIYRCSLAAAAASFGRDLTLTGLAAATALESPTLRTPSAIDAYHRHGRYLRHRFGPNKEIPLSCHRSPIAMTPETTSVGLVVAPAPLILIDIARFAKDEAEAAVAIDGLLRLQTNAARLYMDANAIASLRRAQRRIIDECEALLEQFGPNQRAGRARRILARASILNESPGESRLWLVLQDSGLALPSQQVTLRTRGGPRRADFLWEKERIIAEFDGDAKYAGEAGRARMLDDRKRDHHLNELGYSIIHFDWKQLDDPAAVRLRLLQSGVPLAE